ncbi:MAG TPA: thermosome subunit, partial [Candidatus Bathyarchaeota archaeon]|nr:thermosome subunit [Candidatus Bathyarchaeota archaeon]
INVFTGKTINTYEAGVIEPIRVKEHAIKSAEEAASMIIRIDDVIAASRLKEEEREKAPKPPEMKGEF